MISACAKTKKELYTYEYVIVHVNNTQRKVYCNAQEHTNPDISFTCILFFVELFRQREA